MDKATLERQTQIDEFDRALNAWVDNHDPDLEVEKRGAVYRCLEEPLRGVDNQENENNEEGTVFNYRNFDR